MNVNVRKNNMGSRRPRKLMLDFSYRYIQKHGIQTPTELYNAYIKDTKKGYSDIGVCSRKAFTMTLSKSNIMVKVKQDFGRDINKNKIYKYDIKDIDEVARRLASLKHLQTEPKHFPKILKDAYDNACEAQSADLNTMKERV
tara:strand:- start:401 stop:826 length:426 start_codon:yes stop_codon:yes gene_type:complete